MSLWRDLLKPRNSFAAERTLFWIIFAFGLTPLRISTDYKIYSSRLGYIIALLQILFFTYCCIHSFTVNESVVGYFFKSDISRISDLLQKVIGICGMLILFGVSLYKSHDLIHIYNVIGNIDNKFLELGIEFNYGFIMKFRVTQLLFVFSLCITYMSSSVWMLFHNEIWPSYQALVSFFFPHLYFLCTVVVITSFQMRFAQYLQLINTVLKNFGQQWEKHNNGMIISKQNPFKYNKSFYIYTMVNKKSCDTIKESMNVHQLICEVSSTANKYFTYQLLTIISIAFVIILFDAYYILETLLDKTKYDSKFHTFEFIIFFSIHMVLHLIAIVSIVETSNHALKMSEKTGNMVHILLNETKESDVKERLQQFSMQLLHLKINFTAADLFNVNRTLYFTISGALTTYLIILLQFNLNSLSQSTDRIQYNENYNNGHKMDDVLHNLTVLTI